MSEDKCIRCIFCEDGVMCLLDKMIIELDDPRCVDYIGLRSGTGEKILKVFKKKGTPDINTEMLEALRDATKEIINSEYNSLVDRTNPRVFDAGITMKIAKQKCSAYLAIIQKAEEQVKS